MPEIFSQAVFDNEQITKMRQAVRKAWNQLSHLQSALTDAKAIELKEGQSVDQEVSLIEAQIAKLTKV